MVQGGSPPLSRVKQRPAGREDAIKELGPATKRSLGRPKIRASKLDNQPAVAVM